MARSIVLGNGNILVGFDKRGLLKDFYFHYVGLENHVGDKCIHRIGVMIDGKLSWLLDKGWEFFIDYKKETMVSEIRAVNKELEVELGFNDVVYNEKNILIRRVTVKNNASWKREVKIFFHQMFRLYDTERGDTGYFDPDKNVLIHYEGRRVFSIGATHNGKPFENFSVGNYGIEGKEGTWRDAEDGILEKNAVEYAYVDSVLGFDLEVAARKRERVDYWITVAKDIEKVKDLHDFVLRKTPEHIAKSAGDFWKAWLKKSEFNFRDLNEKTIDLFKKSLLIMRTHAGNNGGIIASGDSDMLQYGKGTYAYIWPRDASFIAISFDRTGYDEISHRFYQFCNDTISRDGYFFHKYLSDKSVGSSWHPWYKDGEKQLAIQEEETALVLFGLWRHYKTGGDIEFIESIYNSLIKKAADFMVDYRDAKTGLPRASYDIWEQSYGTSTFAAASVYGGLIAAANFSNLLGKEDDKFRFQGAAREIRDGIIKHFYNEDKEYFYKSIKIKEGEDWEYDDTIDASSFYGLFKFKVLEKNDPTLKKAFKVLKNKLKDQTEIGGVIRYEGDEYRRVKGKAPNPWFITTLWCAQYEIATAKNKEELTNVKRYFDWVLKYAMSSGVLAEQVRSDNGEPVSAAPLIWSHAELVTTVTEYLERFEDITEEIPLKKEELD